MSNENTGRIWFTGGSTCKNTGCKKTHHTLLPGWVNMQEWWVNMIRNGGSTCAGIYTQLHTTTELHTPKITVSQMHELLTEESFNWISESVAFSRKFMSEAMAERA